jgi:hypothetical protein
MNKGYEWIIHWEKKREDSIPYSKTIWEFKNERDKAKNMDKVPFENRRKQLHNDT